jgi:Carbohydrate-binding family 9
MLIWYITDATPVPGGLRASTEVPPDLGRTVGVYHSLPRHLPVEIHGPVEWRLQLSIPLGLLERYVGPLGALGNQRWRANLFKCADNTSHPHWASWSPIGDTLNFHDPRHFGQLKLL